MARNQSAGGERTATELLVQDHKRVQKLFKDFERIDREDTDALRELVETACLELQIHSLLEEEIFYPAVRAQVSDADSEDVLNEFEVEHESVDELIAKLHELEPDDPMYRAYFKIMTEQVKRHVREEEQKLFAHAERMNALDLRQLAEDMRSRREELFAEMERGDDELPELTVEDDDSVPEADEETLEDEQGQIDISRTRH